MSGLKWGAGAAVVEGKCDRCAVGSRESAVPGEKAEVL